jgi:hypothetical protein
MMKRMCLIHDRARERNNFPDSSTEERQLRAELDLLLARYDSGAIRPAVFTTIKALEVDIAWCQHRRRP